MSCAFSRREAENLGVEVYPGFAGAEVLYGEKGEVVGVATGDMGVGRDGKPKDSFTRGMELKGKYTIFAEGARGSLTKQLLARYDLCANSEPQKFGIGFKELWRIPKEKHKDGLVQHSFGWPLAADTGGGSFLYHFDDDLVSIGFVVHLNYSNPTLSPFDEFQRFKTHPLIAPTLEGGERLSYGARALTEGGWQSVPKLVMPGGALAGCGAGFMNVPRIKGSHNAMLSGILCAEHIAAAIGEGRAHDEVNSYDAAWRSSDIGRDLKRVRNVKPLWSKYGTYVGAPLFGLDMWTNELFGFSFFGTLKHGKADYETLKPVSEVTPIVYPKRASKLVFDKLSSVFVSNTNHEEDQPVHLKLADPAIPIERNLPDLWRAGSALLSGGRLRSGLCRRSDAPRSALRDQCAKLRSLQNLRHQGPGAKYHLGPPGGRRRTELSEYVTGAAQAPALREANGPRPASRR